MYTVVGDVAEGGFAHVEAGVTWKLSVLSAQFCCAPKIAVKNK